VCSDPPSGADNLGNHTATTNLQMATYDIYGSSGSASADGNFDISGVDNISANQVAAGNGSFGFTAAIDAWTGFDVTGLNKRIILGVTGGQTRNVFDIERTDTWAHLMELRANGSAFFGNNVNIQPPTGVEGVWIKSSDYSPLVIRNTADTLDLFRVNQLGNVTANGTIVGNFAAYDAATCTNGQVLIKNASSQWVCGTASGSDNLGNHTATTNLNMSEFSIFNIGSVGTGLNPANNMYADKITVTTIDPVYTIKGEKYATYMAGMTGVKEETTGLFNLVYNKKTGIAELVMDFDNLEKGSDVWLFAQTIKYTENFDKVVVLLTPSFDGRVWYEKDLNAHTMTIIGKPINTLSKNYEVSYRLTGPRFDYKEWPNTTDEEVEGLIIE